MHNNDGDSGRDTNVENALLAPSQDLHNEHIAQLSRLRNKTVYFPAADMAVWINSYDATHEYIGTAHYLD